MKKLLNYLLLSLLLFACQPKSLQDEGSNSGSKNNSDRSRETRNNDRRSTRTKNRTSELRRLTRSDDVLTSTVRDRFSGYSISRYGGEQCEESDRCKEICDSVFSSGTRRRCYRASRDLIETVEDGFFQLLNIDEADSVDISPAFISGILELDRDSLIDLVKRMSEGDLKSFLAWIAINEDISKAFLIEDRSGRVITKALDELGDLQRTGSGSRSIENALNAGLIVEEDTFLSLAAEQNNVEGFKIAYDILNKKCSTDCKKEVLCARVYNSNSRSRIFGSSLECKTSTRSGRSRSTGACYIQGSAVWSFLQELIEEDDINDNDFEDDILDVNTCNTFCGTESSTNTKCNRIL